MADALLARCHALLDFPGCPETGKDRPVSIPADDPRALIERASVASPDRRVPPYVATTAIPPGCRAGPPDLVSPHAAVAIDRALNPVDYLDL